MIVIVLALGVYAINGTRLASLVNDREERLFPDNRRAFRIVKLRGTAQLDAESAVVARHTRYIVPSTHTQLRALITSSPST